MRAFVVTGAIVWAPTTVDAQALPQAAASGAAARAPARPTAGRAPSRSPEPAARSTPKASPAPVAHQAPAAPAAPAAMTVAKGSKLLVAPGGQIVGELAPGAVVQPLAHDHGFAKVRVEGWVPEHDLVPGEIPPGAQLTAAELRADPEGTRGRFVQWEVQVLSLQIADALRSEFARDEPYLLAKGPGAADALLYLAVPPALLAEAKALPPLTHVLITARVRVGRSEPVGTPILDLKSISKR